MNQPVEIGNVISLPQWEPGMRYVGVVTDVEEDWITCVMLTMRLNRRTGKYRFGELEAEYLIDRRETNFEVVELPSKLVGAE